MRHSQDQAIRRVRRTTDDGFLYNLPMPETKTVRLTQTVKAAG